MLVLPLPLGPTSPKICPLPISRETFLSARKPPNASSISRQRSRASPRSRSLASVTAPSRSDPEDAVMRPVDRRVERHTDRHRQRVTGIRRVQYAIVPQLRGGIIGAGLAAVFFPDRVPAP